MIGGYCPRLEPAAKERIMALFLTRLIVLTLFLTGPASAKKPECSLALAFALDVSVSVDDAEYEMQRDGLASALWDPVVRSVILSQPGAVALMAYEWSGHSQQIIIAPWAFIASEQDLSAFIAHLSGHERVEPMYSDGRIDPQEKDKLLKHLGDLGREELDFVNAELAKPMDVNALVRNVPKGSEGQVYMMSLMGIDLDSNHEARYLHELSQALGLTPQQVNAMHDRLGEPRLFR